MLGNLNSPPYFSNNFFLKSTSPAINSGNPASELDPDGSIADMGARYFSGITQPIIFNEINYYPSNGDEIEFIELYNTSIEPIDISGYKIKGAIDFTFPIWGYY